MSGKINSENLWKIKYLIANRIPLTSLENQIFLEKISVLEDMIKEKQVEIATTMKGEDQTYDKWGKITNLVNDRDELFIQALKIKKAHGGNKWY